MPKFSNKPPRARSNCWYYYTKCDVGGKCRLCGREVKSSGCTTNLINHLKRNHKEQFSDSLPIPEDTEVASFPESGKEEDYIEDSRTSNDNSKGLSISETSHGVVENNHSQPIAYQTEGGETVIWLQTPSEKQNTFQPQITVVQHSVPEISEHSNSHPSETILANGEIVTNVSVTATEGHTTVSHSQLQEKSAHNDTKKTYLKASRTSNCSMPMWSPSPVKVARNNLISASTDPGREDVYDKFGKYIASLLRNLSSKKAACRLQKEIVWLVLQEQIRTEDT